MERGASSTFAADLLANEAGDLAVAVLDRMPDGVAIFGRNFEPLYANAIALSRFQVMFQSLADGATIFESIVADTRGAMPHYSDAKVRELAGEVYQAMLAEESITVRARDGRYVAMTYKQVGNGARIAVSTDITDLRQRERELMTARAEANAANAARAMFLANTSHEVRTPLNAVVGLAQILSKYDLPQDAREHVASIFEAGTKLTALLNDILDLSNMEAGRVDIRPTDSELRNCLGRLLRLWRPRAAEKGIDLNLSLDADIPPLLHYDPTRLRQCVSHLIANAIKFSREGFIDVVARAKRIEDNRVRVTISVRDDGVGLSKEDHERLFDAFALMDSTASREESGLGLGLTITRKLARQMGGDLTVESELGKGSVFTLTMVCDDAQTPLMPAVAPAAAQGGARQFKDLRVLIVDDILINRRVASLFLAPLGCKVDEAESGAAALEMIEREDYDVVFLDIHMPGMDGTEVIQRIRTGEKRLRSLKVIALTADALSGDRERYLGLGMDGYVSKPITEMHLVTELQRVLMENGGAAQTATA
ncbi:MAG: response regulator [Pseudomonadota bacterium]